MKNRNEVNGKLLLGCTVLRITREVPFACPATDSSHNIVTPRETPELYAKPYSLTVNFQSLHFYFSCMHSARMLRSVGKNNTDCTWVSDPGQVDAALQISENRFMQISRAPN